MATGMTMKATTSAGIDLAYDVRGSGEPVVLIHGGGVPDEFLPLAGHQVLEGYRLIRYHRRGYGSSSPAQAPVSVQDQARDCAALLSQLDIAGAHVVGHSYGGTIALQLALDAPDLVHSLALLEPGLFMVPSAATFLEGLAPVLDSYQHGDKAHATEMFLKGVGRPNAPEIMDGAVPGAFDQAVRDADTLFQVDLPGLQRWKFNRDDAVRIRQPVLYLLGGDSFQPAFEGRDLLRDWLPQSRDTVIGGVTHSMLWEDPQAVAESLAEFLKAHPLAATTTTRS